MPRVLRFLGLTAALCVALPAGADDTWNNPAAPRPRGDSLTLNVPISAQGGLHMTVKPGLWSNATLRVFSPYGALVADLRTADDGSFDQSLANLPLAGNYQIQIITAAPGIPVPTPASGMVSFAPWTDIYQPIQSGVTYEVTAPMPLQQVVMGLAATGKLPIGCQVQTTSPTSLTLTPVALYLYGPDGRLLRSRGPYDENDVAKQGGLVIQSDTPPPPGNHQLVALFGVGRGGSVKATCAF